MRISLIAPTVGNTRSVYILESHVDLLLLFERFWIQTDKVVACISWIENIPNIEKNFKIAIPYYGAIS